MSGQRIVFSATDIDAPVTFRGADVARLPTKPVGTEDFLPTPDPQGSATGRFLSNAGEMLNPITALQSLFGAIRHPIDTAGNIIGAQVDQGRQAIDNAKQGRYVEAMGHTGAALLPVLGPAAAQAGEQIGSGDIAGGLGKTVGLLAPVAAPAVLRGARAAAQPALARAAGALEASADADVTTALNPTRHRTKVKTARIAPEVRARGITGSIEDVRALAKEQRGAVGQDVDRALSGSTADVELASVRKALDLEGAETHNLVTQPDGTTKRVVHDARKDAQIQKVRAILDEYGDTMTTEQAVALRRTWDDVVARAGGFDEKAGNQFGVTLDDASEAGVKRPVVSALRKEIVKANPSLKAINQEFKFWADLDDVASATTSRQVGQKRNLTRQIMRGAGMVTAAGSGSGVTGAVLAGEFASRAEALFASTKWKLVSAQVKTKLADAIASGDRDRIASALGQATAAANAPTSRSGSRETPALASGRQP
jgi:hypothetical protein